MIQLGKLETKYTGRNLIYYKSIDSTQKEAWRLVNKSIPNGTLIVSDIQTSGIGTHGRTWYTDEDTNLAFSIVLYPKCNIKILNDFTYKTAEKILSVFKKLYGIDLEIKIPNDIVHSGKKLGGILTETRLFGELINTLIIGIGINLNQEVFNEDIKDIASSIKKEFGITVDKTKILTEICNVFEKELFIKFNN